MKNILLIGVGGTGSSTVDILYQKIHQLGNLTDNQITALVFDTDAGSVANITAATNIPMSDPASVGTVCDRLGKENLREWFPTDDNSVMAQEMSRGASQWRKKSFLAFLNLMNKPEARGAFHRAMENMTKAGPGAAYEIYVVASIAGGTGSGSFIPIALYAQRFLRNELGKSAQCFAVIACPDIYAESQTESNKVKIFANAYAILRELNAINLVARGHNKNCNKEKKPLIRFRIGSKNEANVGLLFDAEDPRFWHPEAAPFRQIYVLDKVPGIHSVRSHEIILANSLYSTLCTGIGKEMDSELSNHEGQVNQSNGSNAIYAGISSAQITFPIEAIKDYVAHEKALAACQGEWLKLHDETESKIREDEREARENHQRFFLEDGEYAERFLGSLENEMENEASALRYIISDATERPTGKRGEPPIQYLDEYVKLLRSELSRVIPSADDVKSDIAKRAIISKPGFFAPKEAMNNAKSRVLNMAATMEQSALDYFKTCVDKIRAASTSLANYILPMDARHTEPLANAKLSLAHHLLSREGKDFIHPVAAMVQLCRLKLWLKKELGTSPTPWSALQTGKAESLPASVVTNANSVGMSAARLAASFYFRQDGLRLTGIIANSSNYRNAHKTDPEVDSRQLKEDALATVDTIHTIAGRLLKDRVLTAVVKRVDILIEEYRNFFRRFGEAKQELAEKTRTCLRRDVGRSGTVMNVLSTEEDKKAILKKANTGGESPEATKKAYHAAGFGVFQTVYGSALFVNDPENASRPSGGNSMNTLFRTMTDSYREILNSNTEFQNHIGMNVIEAMVKATKENGNVVEELEKTFANVRDLATPSLRVNDVTDGSTVRPTKPLILLLMSLSTAQYIRSNATALGLTEPDSASEQIMTAACVEQFVHRYVAGSARYSIVEGIPDHSLYVTGEVLDITPLCIPKFDEMSDTPVYFNYYKKALVNFKKYDTDMWNPHLGFNLHKRGFLPYMNARMEEHCKEQVCKALLFGLLEEKIKFTSLYTNEEPCFCYVNETGALCVIQSSNRKTVNKKNVALLFDWLRNDDELVESWAGSFDKNVTDQLQDLPLAVSESEYESLKKRIESADYVKGLRQGIFRKKKDGKFDYSDSSVRGILEFAYEIKCNEETFHDCDDADALLKVAFDTVCAFFEFRAPFKNLPNSYVNLYHDQLESFAKDLLASLLRHNAGEGEKKAKETKEFADRIFGWANARSLFCPVDTKEKQTDDGEINYLSNTTPIDYFSLSCPTAKKGSGTADKSDKKENN